MNWLNLLTPWHFSPTVVITAAVFAGLYLRGCRRIKVSWPCQLSFWLGMLLLYLALHTRVDYYAEREFFIHRAQHAVLHHLGPFLIALAAPADALVAGLPRGWYERFIQPAARAQPLRFLIRFFTHPITATTIFVGLIWFWLVPGIHFYAMLDIHLYLLMNWSMAADGILFWYLALDRRPSPPARYQPGIRILLLLVVIPPQILPGALLTFASHNIYPLYDLCGRAFSGIAALADQSLGGLILWIPTSMMSVIGALIILAAWFKDSEAKEPLRPTATNADSQDKNAPA